MMHVTTFVCNKCVDETHCISQFITDIDAEGHNPDHCVYGKEDKAIWEKQTTGR